MILFDIILLLSGVQLPTFFTIIGWEMSMFIGLVFGLRGIAQYRETLFELRAIANDSKLDDKEDLRGHLLKQMVREACMEYDIWFLKDQYHKSTTKEINNNKIIQKKVINKKMPIKPEAIKQLWYFIAGLFLAFGFALNDFMLVAQLRPLWVITINIAWYGADFLFFWYLYWFWDIKKEDVTPGPVLFDDEKI